MRKTTTTRYRVPNAQTLDGEMFGSRPGRLKGATITSCCKPRATNLVPLFAEPTTGSTVSGGSVQSKEPCGFPTSVTQTVLLSDGTQITFTTAGQSTAFALVCPNI